MYELCAATTSPEQQACTPGGSVKPLLQDARRSAVKLIPDNAACILLPKCAVALPSDMLATMMTYSSAEHSLDPK
jgi:hypothetical protein